MAKNCSICEKKLGFLDGKINVSDGIVCTSCWTKAGMNLGTKAMLEARKKTVNQLIDLIDLETVKSNPTKKATPKTKEGTSKTKAAPQEKTLDMPEPVDFFITVDKEKRVTFSCVGAPLINYDDLINGREMILGDGYLKNESKVSLPEMRILCDFDPAIVDPGMLSYDADTFHGGADVRFEIEDPPVNLTEYAKVKRTRKGKIKFTLLLGDKEVGTAECPMKVKPAPAKEMERVMAAITYEEEKQAAGPVNIFLDTEDGGSFQLDLMRQPELLYALYANGQEQLIGDVYVSNKSKKKLKDIRFEASFTSDILSPINILLGDVAPGENRVFEVDDPAIHVDKLAVLTDVDTCIATYRLSVAGKVVAEATGRITICPYNQWDGAPILLPAYITPNHPLVIKVLQDASRWMMSQGLDPSLVGYQGDAQRVNEMIGAVYYAIKGADIVYSMPPASFFGPQRIRLCESVLEHKFGTCMDMTILFASCLESFGLHPVLILVPQHIFAGVWLGGKEHLPEPLVSDPKKIKSYIDKGQLIAVECTAMNAGKDIPFKKAKEIAYETVKEVAAHDVEDHCCIDVLLTRAGGIRPLPMRVGGKVEERIVPQPAHETVASEDKQREEKPKKKVEKTVEKTAEKKPEKKAEKTPEKTPEPEPTVEKQAAVPVYEKVDYQEYQGDLSSITADNFYEKSTKALLKNAIVEIVEMEGPISQPALIKTLVGATALGRASKQIYDHLDKLVVGANVKITRQDGVRFLWEYGADPSSYMVYRYKEQRSPEDICKYEMKNAVAYLIQENGPMTKEELTKAMVSLLGYSRAGKNVEAGAASALKSARELKAVALNDDKKFELI